MPIHATAIVDSRAELDGTVEVGPYCVIEQHVRVDAGCRLYHGVYLTGWTHVGPDCELHPGVIVGHAPQDRKYGGQRSYCSIGRGTVLREHATVHRGTEPESRTVVGENCFLLAGSHVGHNCRVGDNVTIINNALLGGHVQVGDRVTISGGAGVHQFVRIGELAMIGGLVRVIQDILPFAMVDEDGQVAGFNRIGLRRANFSQDEIHDISQAYRVLLGKETPFREAIKRLPQVVTTLPGKRLLEFVQAESRRGYALRSGSTRNTVASGDDRLQGDDESETPCL